MVRGKFAQRRMKGTTMTVAVANKGRKGGEDAAVACPRTGWTERGGGRGVLKMKLARGTTAAAALHNSGLVGVSRGRNGISELRTCATAQIRFSSLPRPSLLTSECVCVFGVSIQFQRKPKVVVSYTSRARVPTLPPPPASDGRRSIRGFVLSGRPQIPRGAPNDLSSTFRRGEGGQMYKN